MKLKDAIANIDKSNPDWADFDVFSTALDLGCFGCHEEFAQRVKKYWITKWLCTDSHVGNAVYFFDDEPVAVSFQSARKSDENLKFISKVAADKVQTFILSLEEDQQQAFCDLEEDIGDHFVVSYGSNLLTKDGTYEDKPVTVVKQYGYESPHTMWQKVDVKQENGEIITIDLTDFHIPFCLK